MAAKHSTIYTTSSCEYCRHIDTDDMVQCDDCDKWYHFICVGVTIDVASKDWKCDGCKYALPRNPSFNKQDKENHPPERWRAPKTRSLSSVSSLSTTSTTRSKVLALQRLDEERALNEKRDREYLHQKYSILQGTIDELGEIDSADEGVEKSSLEDTLRWTKEVQNLSKDFDAKFNMGDLSISLSDAERTAFAQQFIPSAQSSTNMNRHKTALLSSGDREREVVAVQQSLDPCLSEIHRNKTNTGNDSVKATINIGNSSSQRIRSNKRAISTEVAIPLQSKVVDNQKSATFNVTDSSKSSAQLNPIQQPKLQLTGSSKSSPGNVRFNPIQPSKLQRAAKLQSGIRSALNESEQLSTKYFNFPSTNFGIFGQFKPNDVRLNPATSEFRPESGNSGVKRPKFEIDKFAFSTVKSPTSNVRMPNVNFHQSTPFGQTRSQSSIHQSMPFGQPHSQSSIHQSTPFIQPQKQLSIHQSTPLGQPFDYRELCKSYVDLTANQIAARHTMNKKLPEFFGEPMKWQLFESAFINSTESCGLTNAENLSRLTDSLKGDAIQAVQCRLLHPSSVPGVMETLRLLYGRPELIIQSLLEEIESTPAPRSDNLGSLIKFSISVQNLCSTVESYNAVEHLRNPTLIKALTDKLPTQIQLNWAYYKHNVGDVNLSTLGDWLYGLATIASDVVTSTSNSSNDKKSRKDENTRNFKSENYVNVQQAAKIDAKSTKSGENSSRSRKRCPACNKDICKVLAFCEKFKKMSRQEKWKLVKSNNLCGCCLGNHRYFNCQQKVVCGVAGCSFFHHVMLHNESKDKKESTRQNSNSNDDQKKNCNSMKGYSGTIQFPDIFRILPVRLFSNGKSIRIYAYFDDGSNLTTLEFSVAKKLGLQGSSDSLCVKWSFGETQVESDSRRVSMQISGVHDGAETFSLDDVRTVKNLQLPTQSITKSWLGKYSYFDDIPIIPYQNATPQMIIGLHHSKLMVSLKTIEGDWEQPIACKTRLGWVVQGPNDNRISPKSSNEFSLNVCECQSSDNDLHQLVKEFFSLESFGVKISDRIVESKELMRARSILESSTIKKGNHYEAALLWRKDDVRMPSSIDMATRRLECVESKMKKNPILAERMCEYIKDFLAKGYIRKLSQQEQRIHGPRTWYLPVFPVFNPKKPEKLRLVWDGAAKVKGVSLNSELMVGPDQLEPLPDILRRFREAWIGISTDIIEMFHRIFVNQKDQDSQRFLWRDGDDLKEPDVYVVNVLTFGLSCSPATAQFVKNKNGQEFERQQKFQKAVEAVTKNHYVDDMIERAHSVEEAVKLIKDVQLIHRQANFDLRNLISNNQQVLEVINGSPEFNDKILTDKLDINVERILGMYWNTKTDTFTYSLRFIKINEFSEKHGPTKREVLRIVMSVFDPLGFLAHLMVHAKVLIQEIWRHEIGWDDQLPVSLRGKWFKWLQYLKLVENLHIPRLYSPRMSPSVPKSIQLHIFVDASTEAYAASAYLRIDDGNGVDSCIVGAKSRVAPNKPISVPRLELQGAVLGTRFAESILKSHYSLNVEKTVIWCDSKTVLFWLDTAPRRYSQFVAFRIGEILDSKMNAQWRWIPSEINVADEATKTKNSPELQSSSRWFIGPEFLRSQNPDFSFELDEPNFTTEEEVRPYYLLTHLEVPVSKLIDYERFSNWHRLLRTTSFVIRFIQNSKLERHDRSFDVFSSNELLAAENLLFRQVQFDCFKEEIVIVRWNETAPLDKQKDFDKTSIIRTCSPYLDDFGVLRVKGRLDNAHSIAESARRPIILPRNHYVTRLIVYWYHRKYRHLHHQTVLNEIRQKFWIPKLRMVLNGIRNSCQKCKNSAAVPQIPEMGAIPKARLAVFTRPFTFVGLDYFGPIQVIVNRGTQKRWGALFTCLTTRGIHLEVAHSLDTSSCIMAIRNFIGRKGQPREFYSDNGTNFHGANNVFLEEIAKLDQAKLQEEFVTSEIKWSFNPPTAAHMGGVWERMVGIVKTCLDEVLTVRYPSDEMLKSLFVEIEIMVNSRPLTYVSLESPDDEVLTPNHFLFGSSNGTKPPGEFHDADLLRNNWRTIQAMSDKFWHKFVDEYLPTLTRRVKWFRQVEPLKVDDMVILVDSSFQRNTWPKGIVIETFNDNTGQVRSARVRTATGTIYRRPVSHLAVLDVGQPGRVKLDSPNQLTGARLFDNTGQH